jgi:uncharacterized protein YigA (DUF484 family)
LAIVIDRTTQGILEVARGVLAELDLDQVLDRVLESAQELTEARYAALGVLNESRTELGSFLTRGIDEAAHTAIGALPRGRGVLGALISDPAPPAFSVRYRFPYGVPSTRIGTPRNACIGGCPAGKP